MLKFCNRLLIALVLFTVVSCAWHAEAEARRMGLGSSSAYSQLKPGARAATGEPDVGDNKNGPPNAGNGTNYNNGGTGAPITPNPNGYRWIIAAWAARYLGVGW